MGRPSGSLASPGWSRESRRCKVVEPVPIKPCGLAPLPDCAAALNRLEQRTFALSVQMWVILVLAFPELVSYIKFIGALMGR